MNKDTIVGPGMVVQISPKTSNPIYSYCLMIVTEVKKDWGFIGYIQVPGVNGGISRPTYYSAKYEDVEFVGDCIWMDGQL
jgi:hypothetical protein